jgi:hypothetical protein
MKISEEDKSRLDYRITGKAVAKCPTGLKMISKRRKMK